MPERTKIDYSDPYVWLDSPHFPGYAQRLRQLGVLDNLTSEDAEQVAGAIMTDQMGVGLLQWWGGPRAPRDIRLALQQRAANVGAGADVRQWHDPSAVSNAFGIAADAVGYELC